MNISIPSFVFYDKSFHRSPLQTYCDGYAEETWSGGWTKTWNGGWTEAGRRWDRRQEPELCRKWLTAAKNPEQRPSQDPQQHSARCVLCAQQLQDSPRNSSSANQQQLAIGNKGGAAGSSSANQQRSGRRVPDGHKTLRGEHSGPARLIYWMRFANASARLFGCKSTTATRALLDLHTSADDPSSFGKSKQRECPPLSRIAGRDSKNCGPPPPAPVPAGGASSSGGGVASSWSTKKCCWTV